MRKSITLLACVLTVIGCQIALAGNRPGAVTITPAVGYYMFSSQRDVDNTKIPNLSLSYNFNDRWAAEAGYGVLNTNNTSGPGGTHGSLYMADGIYRLAPRHLVEPYMAAGVGVLKLNHNGLDSETQADVNAGIGAQFFFDNSIAFRAEARDLYTVAGGKNDVMINVGISFLIGGDTPVTHSTHYKDD